MTKCMWGNISNHSDNKTNYTDHFSCECLIAYLPLMDDLYHYVKLSGPFPYIRYLPFFQSDSIAVKTCRVCSPIYFYEFLLSLLTNQKASGKCWSGSCYSHGSQAMKKVSQMRSEFINLEVPCASVAL